MTIYESIMSIYAIIWVLSSIELQDFKIWFYYEYEYVLNEFLMYDVWPMIYYDVFMRFYVYSHYC